MSVEIKPIARGRAEYLKWAEEQPGHVTRFSDASTFDEICIKCGETDADGAIRGPCYPRAGWQDRER